ncbi:MAG TPA: Flp pilus assembly protein CpaB [Mycobacteriales bacterium]|nr:Flp pilus assembly protein CpaB [Mycobacteriales bacterium]
MGRRTLLLIAALVVAALGTTLVFAYVNRTDERALRDQEPVNVLVAKSLIRAGTTGAQAEGQGSFKLQAVPRSALVTGYLQDARSIGDLIAVSDIYPGEQIIPQKFAAAGTSGVLPIPSGKVGMSFQLGDPQRVAGFVRPGSDVAVFLTVSGPAAGAGATGPVTRLLLPKLSVLAVGPTTLRPASNGDTNTEAVPTAILTLAVDQTQGQKMIFASQSGTLYFALLSKDSKVAPGPGTDARNLFS